MRRRFYILVVLLILSACTGTPCVCEPETIEENESCPLQANLKLDKSSYDVGERIYCTLKITNKSGQIVSIPDISIMSRKGNIWPEGIILCLKYKVLRIAVDREGQPIEMRREWQVALSSEDYLPVIRAMPGEEIEAKFPLAARWAPIFFSVKKAGNYSVTVILNTTKQKEAPVWEGCVSSNSVSFFVSEVPVFREKEGDESERDYAKVRTDFYVDRIVQNKGEYFRNVGLILKAKECGYGLISLLDSQDKKKSVTSKQILEAIHSQVSQDSKRKLLPKSRDEWVKWWSSTGSKKSYRELWHNFDSHHQ